MRRSLAVVFAIAIAIVAVAGTWAYLGRYLAEVPATVLWVISGALEVVIFVLDRLRGQPHLRAEPLPHLKGWMRPTGQQSDWEMYQGEEPRIGPKPSWGTPTNPERVGHGIHPSQVLELVWLDPTQHPGRKAKSRFPRQGEAWPTVVDVRLNFQAYKFGVISITNTGAEAEHCSAHGEYQLKGRTGWHDLGDLNWYSRSKRRRLKVDTSKQQALLANTAEGLNDALSEPHADVSKNATKEDEFDIGLFYMLCEPAAPYVFMCGSDWTPIESQASAEHRLTISLKIRFKARGMDPFTKYFGASVAPDDFTIWEEDADGRRL